MTTLEKWVRNTLKYHQVYANKSLIDAAVQQIEKENESEDGLYTPDDWYWDTKRNFPEMLLESDIYGPICSHLIEQRNECFDQTGSVPCLYDYGSEMESQMFKDHIGDYNLDDVFNFLLSYYAQKETEEG